MGVGKRQEAIRGMRGRMWSPGRPSKARREDRVRSWEAVAGGLSSEDAASEAGVSQAVGSRWFRQAGGMPPICFAPVSGRYLSQPSGKRSRSYMRSILGCVRSVAAWAVARLRSRGSWGVTRQLAVMGCLIGQRLRSGTRNGVLVARRCPSWLPTTACASMCRIALVG